MSKCVEDILKKEPELVDKFSPDQLRSIAKQLTELKAKAEQRGESFHKLFGEMINSQRKNIAQIERQRLLNLKQFEYGKEFTSQFDDVSEGIGALLAESNMAHLKGKGSVTAQVHRIYDKSLSPIVEAIHKNDLQRAAVSGELDEALYRILGKGDDSNIKNPAIRELAGAIRKHHDYMLRLKRNSGFAVDKMDDYIVKQRHPAAPIREMGLNKFTSLARNTWDFDRMGIPDTGAQEAFIEDVFNKAINSDIKGFITVGEQFKTIELNALAASAAKRRAIHFKDGKAAFDYNKAVDGGTLINNLMAGSRRESANIASARVFGPNPNATFEKLLEHGRRAASAKGEKALSKFKRKESMLRDQFKYATERFHRPERGLVSKTFLGIRMLADVSKLTTSLFSTSSDFAIGGGVLSQVNGSGYLANTANYLRNFAKMIPSSNKKAFGNKLQIFMGDWLGDVNTRFGTMNRELGALSRGHQTIMRLTGLPWQAHTAKTAFAKSLSTEFADISHLKLKDIPAGMKQALDRFGIDSDKWDFLRKFGVDDYADGTRGITPEMIQRIPDSEIKAKFGKTFDAQKFKDDLDIAYSTMLGDFSELGSPTPGLKQQWWKETLDPNSPMGLVAEFIGQYKSFTLKAFDSMTRIKNTGVHTQGVGGFTSMIPTLIGGTAMGFLALNVQDIVNGRVTDVRDFRRFDDPTTWIDAFVKSGMGLVYADLLTAQYNKSYRSFAADLMGPGVGIIDDFATLFARAIREPFTDEPDGRKIAGQAFRTLQRNFPMVPFTRGVVNKLAFDQINELLNPGYTRRQMVRKEKKRRRQ